MAPASQSNVGLMQATVRLDQLQVETGWNARFEEAEGYHEGIKLLAESIKATGLAQPLIVRLIGNQMKFATANFLVRSGHRRYAALQRIAAEDPAWITANPIPVLIRKGTAKAGGVDDLNLMLADLQSRPLSVPEAASTIPRLRALKATDSQIMAALGGITPQTLNNYERFLTATPETIAMVEKGMVAATSIFNLLGKEGPERTEALVQEAVKLAADDGKGKASNTYIADAAADPEVQAKLDEVAPKPEVRAAPKPPAVSGRPSRATAPKRGRGRPPKSSNRPQPAGLSEAVSGGSNIVQLDTKHPWYVRIKNGAKHVDGLVHGLRNNDRGEAAGAIVALLAWYKGVCLDMGSAMPKSPLADLSMVPKAEIVSLVDTAFDVGMFAQRGAAKINIAEPIDMPAATVNGLPLEVAIQEAKNKAEPEAPKDPPAEVNDKPAPVAAVRVPQDRAAIRAAKLAAAGPKPGKRGAVKDAGKAPAKPATNTKGGKGKQAAI